MLWLLLIGLCVNVDATEMRRLCSDGYHTHSRALPIKYNIIFDLHGFKGVVFEGTPKLPSKYYANGEIFSVVRAFIK